MMKARARCILQIARLDCKERICAPMHKFSQSVLPEPLEPRLLPRLGRRCWEEEAWEGTAQSAHTFEAP